MTRLQSAPRTSRSPDDDDGFFGLDVDGRRLRSVRTRARIIDAALSLTSERDGWPTLAAVAERAGVALRTIYHHFGDAGALRLAALSEAEQRSAHRLHAAGRIDLLEERVERFVHELGAHHERSALIRRAVLTDAPTSQDARRELASHGVTTRDLLAKCFSAELERSGRRREVFDALEAVSSAETWRYLRFERHRSIRATERAIRTSFLALLDAS